VDFSAMFNYFKLSLTLTTLYELDDRAVFNMNT